MVQDASQRWISVLMADLEQSLDVFDTLMPRNTLPPLLCTLGCRGVEFGDGESFLFICVSFIEQETVLFWVCQSCPSYFGARVSS